MARGPGHVTEEMSYIGGIILVSKLKTELSGLCVYYTNLTELDTLLKSGVYTWRHR